MSMVTARDGTDIYFKDWGAGQPVVFSYGWPLSADAFEDQMFFLASRGCRCIAHDRRGHGRSGQPWVRSPALWFSSAAGIPIRMFPSKESAKRRPS